MYNISHEGHVVLQPRDSHAKITDSDSAPTVGPDSEMSGYPCITKHSFMLNVPCRGSMDDPESRYKGNKAAFMQHNQLALAKQAFAKYFHHMPVGISLTPVKNTLSCSGTDSWMHPVE